MKTFNLKAEKRDITGRKVKTLRKEGVLPGNVFGKKIKSQSIKVNTGEFNEVFKEAGETSIVELMLGKEKRPVLIQNVQMDPVSDLPLHVDFRQVDLKEKVTADVPVELIGEAPAEKQGLGTLVQYIDEIEVEALPTDLPEKFELDVSGLSKVDDAITINDLNYDKTKVSIELDKEEIITKVEALREEEPEPVKEELAEGEEAKPEGEEEKAGEESQKEEGKETEEKKEEGK